MLSETREHESHAIENFIYLFLYFRKVHHGGTIFFFLCVHRFGRIESDAVATDNRNFVLAFRELSDLNNVEVAIPRKCNRPRDVTHRASPILLFSCADFFIVDYRSFLGSLSRWNERNANALVAGGWVNLVMVLTRALRSPDGSCWFFCSYSCLQKKSLLVCYFDLGPEFWRI